MSGYLDGYMDEWMGWGVDGWTDSTPIYNSSSAISALPCQAEHVLRT